MSQQPTAIGATSAEEKRALLARLLREKLERPRPHPLSFAQERLWFLDQLVPGSANYNIPSAIRLTGGLQVPALERTLGEIVRRHEMLRTTFPSDEGRPVQLVHPPRPFELRVTDLSGLPREEREAAARARVAELSWAPFDLAEGPLLRVELLRLGEREHVLALVMHHIVSDGWSTGVLVREMVALYRAFALGARPTLPELPVQYADFARWQRQWLQGEELERQLSYWRGQLAGAPPVLELPADRPRPAVQSYRGATEGVWLPDELADSLRELSRREGTTLFMTMLAAFQALLSRHTGQPDICVGTPIAGRNRMETEGLIGFFANTLVLRARVDGRAPFRELLARVREVVLEAHAHEDLPFEKLVEAVQPERSMSHAPLFQVMFFFNTAGEGELKIPGFELAEFGSQGGAAKFDLTLGVMETGRRLYVTAEYSTDLFDAETIRRLLAHYQNLLAAAAAEPALSVRALPLMSADESRQLLADLNGTERDYPKNLCVHRLFEEQARRTPEAPALIFKDESLTYAELNRSANRLARRLRALGVGPETPVGVMLERSAEMVVALLGILKAGGAYVPLDPEYPRERLAFMLSDSGVPLLLTREHLAEILPPRREDGARLVFLDEGWQASAHEAGESFGGADSDGPDFDADEDFDGGATPDSLAYVIYTSGSTGRPKGAMNQHGAVSNRLLWMQEQYGLTPADRVLQKTPFSFDVSVWEFFWPLMTGAALVVAEPGGHRDPAYLTDVIRGQRVTTVHFVPSMLRAFLEHPAAGECTGLRRVVCSGEALPAELAEDFFRKLGAAGPELHNLYGPTEAAVDVTHWPCEPDGERRSIPIGRPIANTQIYILSEDLRPVPRGVVGELYIGGANVGRGYWQRPDLTAERFVPDAFGGRPGARLYRTGDLARLSAAGEIEYVGRCDHQVKVRGFRIELGEIEAVLAEHEGVAQAAVVAREGEGGQTRLVAYVVAASEPRPGAVELRDHLRARLPEYMVPSAFVFLEELPLSPNGKLERRALPEPDAAERPEAAGSFSPPQTPVETALAQIWAELLAVRPIGRTDNFFDLGGNSLLAVQLMARVEKKFGQQLPLATLFQGATIAHLGEVLDERRASAPFTPLVALRAEGSRPPFFCVHAIGGEVVGFYRLAQYLGDGQPFYGLQARPLTEVTEEVTPIEELAAQYLEAVRVRQAAGPYLLGGFSFGGAVAFEMAQQLKSAGEEVALLALLDAYSPHFMNKLPEPDEAKQLTNLAWVTARQYGKFVRLDADFMRAMDSEERLNYFLEEMRRAGLVAQGVEAYMLRRFLVGYASRQKASRLYTPRDIYRGRITLFRCEEEDAVFVEMLAQAGADVTDPAHGWGALSDRPVEVRNVPGHHDRMCEEPHVRGLAAALNDCIERAVVPPPARA